MHDIDVRVNGTEEASHGVAEFWIGAEVYAFTRLEEGDLLFHVMPRADGSVRPVGAHALAAALARARTLLESL